MCKTTDYPIYQPEIETMSREAIRALQLEKLQKQVAWTYERVEWYRNKMDEIKGQAFRY